MNGESTGGLFMWAFPILLLVVFYFLLIRPQRQQEKKITAMRKAVQAGDKVITIGGIRGRVVKDKEETLILEIGNQTRIEVMRWSISSVVEPAPDKKDNQKRIATSKVETDAKVEPEEDTSDSEITEDINSDEENE